MSLITNLLIGARTIAVVNCWRYWIIVSLVLKSPLQFIFPSSLLVLLISSYCCNLDRYTFVLVSTLHITSRQQWTYVVKYIGTQTLVFLSNNVYLTVLDTCCSVQSVNTLFLWCNLTRILISYSCLYLFSYAQLPLRKRYSQRWQTRNNFIAWHYQVNFCLKLVFTWYNFYASVNFCYSW